MYCDCPRRLHTKYWQPKPEALTGKEKPFWREYLETIHMGQCLLKHVPASLLLLEKIAQQDHLELSLYENQSLSRLHN
jgi:hypothetical protein